MQGLERPALLHEPGGQVVEQLRVRGRGAAGAEVAGGRDQRLAEVVHPDAVDDDPAGQRVVGGGDGPGQVEPSAAVGEGRRMVAGQDAEELAGHALARLGGIAADEDARVVRLGRVDQHHRPGRGLAGRLHDHPIELDLLAAEGVLLARDM